MHGVHTALKVGNFDHSCSCQMLALIPGFRFQIFVSQLCSRKTKVWDRQPRSEAEQVLGMCIYYCVHALFQAFFSP